jgi:NOL1/NOP2/fmu family ribosome biogenesis protein
MAFIANKERNFQKFVERHFGISIPGGVSIFYREGVRAGNDEINRSGIRGERGYAACDAGFNPTNSFIQNFGHLATKNTVEVDEARAKEFAVGRGLGSMKLECAKGPVAVMCGGYCIGLGMYDPKERKIRNCIPEKRRRKIVNALPAP